MSDTPRTPSAHIISSNPTITVTDIQGREIVWKALSILEQASLFKAVGAVIAENGPYMRLASIAAGVQSIAGVPQPQIFANPASVDGAIGRLGDDGFVAILKELAPKADAEV